MLWSTTTRTPITMKGNDGRAARRKLLRRLGVVFVLFGATWSLLALLGVRGKHFRRRRFAHLQRLASKFGSSKHRNAQMMIRDERQVEQMIVEASLHLVDLEVDYEELAYSPPDVYNGVYGRFCRLNFAAHKKNPTAVPMFRDLVEQSPECEHEYWKVDLQRMARMAREYDRQQQSTAAIAGARTTKNSVHMLNLTAVVFHESRCGSTLVANSLMAMNPEQHRVYSESGPPIVALRICGDLFESCRIDQAARIFQDTLYLMSRSNDPKETRVFYKIQSVGTRYLDVFLQAFPTTPWLFVYRDPVQVMTSHLSDAVDMAYANCVRQYDNPPPAVAELLERRLDLGDVSEQQQQHHQDPHEVVSYEDYCAAYLASLTERAVEALRTSNYGHAVHYPDLPQILYRDILPEKLLGEPLTQQQIDRIVRVSTQYSKGRQGRGGVWHGDSKEKERHATEHIRAAAKLFLQNSYEALVKLSEQDKNAVLK